MIEFIRKYKVQLVVAGVLLFAMQASSKAMAFGAMRGLLRMAMPFIIIYIGYRVVKGMIKKKFQNAFAANPIFSQMQEQMRRQMEMQQQNTAAQTPKGSGTVIDICPNCGEVIKASHRCA